MGGGPIVISSSGWSRYWKKILQGWEYYQTIRTANLDQVLKQEVLNGKRLHRGSNKKCTVRGALRFGKMKKNVKVLFAIHKSLPIEMTATLRGSWPGGRAPESQPERLGVCCSTGSTKKEKKKYYFSGLNYLPIKFKCTSPSPFNSCMVRGWPMFEWMNQLPSCRTVVEVALRCS